MTIDNAIEMLVNEKTQGTKSIILAYWKADLFDKQDDEDWGGLSADVEDQMDWSRTHDQMADLIGNTQKNLQNPC